MEFSLRKKYFNLCDPYEALGPNDIRYLDVDSLGDESRNYVRGTNWVASLADEIALSDKPVFKLLSGHPGSGKTTELKRLAKSLEVPGKGNHHQVRIWVQTG